MELRRDRRRCVEKRMLLMDRSYFRVAIFSLYQFTAALTPHLTLRSAHYLWGNSPVCSNKESCLFFYNENAIYRAICPTVREPVS